MKHSFFKYATIAMWAIGAVSFSAYAADEGVGCDHAVTGDPATPALQDLFFAAQDVIDNYGPHARTPQCIVDPSDPYDPGYLITYGEYNGQCINASSVRPPLVLKEDDHRMIIANFYHEGRYWIAEIPKDAVSSVQFQGIPFDSIGFGLIQFKHGQYRFKLNQPILLREQAGSRTQTATLDDIIVSSTATRPKGIEYSVFKSDAFGIATRVLSSTSRGVEEIADDKSDVHQYELNLSPELKSRFLMVSITRASQEGYKDLYLIWKRNCATTAMDSLDATIPRPDGVKPLRGNLWNLHDEIEDPSLKGLRERKIVFMRVQNMNDEMTCAKAGEMLDGEIVDPKTLGAADARCRFNPVHRQTDPGLF
jgi:hypothetical protein